MIEIVLGVSRTGQAKTLWSLVTFGDTLNVMNSEYNLTLLFVASFYSELPLQLHLYNHSFPDPENLFLETLNVALYSQWQLK